ncbi:MAG: glycosyltransferase family 4 protein [Planctomycetota bacterium]
MKVFMLGWEFPPFISGGLGTACYGLTKALDELGIKVIFVLPKPIQGHSSTHVKLITPDHIAPSLKGASAYTLTQMKHVSFRTIDSPLQPYSTPQSYQTHLEQIIREKRQLRTGSTTLDSSGHNPEQIAGDGHYSGDMYTEVHRYAGTAAQLAQTEDFDVIHAHDWMTYPAGIAVAAVTGKPLIVQVHSTEFDRSGQHVNQTIYDIERKGMHAASRVIAVSNLTRNTIISRYAVPPAKVEVVHNGVERNGKLCSLQQAVINKDEKLVLFLGRITMQKGPEYFLAAAKKVLEVIENVKFVMVGSGDMMHRAVELAAHLGIGHKVLFTGFLRGNDVAAIYKMADLYVMPSVSEPFGIAPLEALDHDVPVIISKQSGVSEVLKHALKVDFWDIEEMANKIIAVLKYPPLQMTLREQGNFEVRRLRWQDSAGRCVKIYEDLVASPMLC